jgi:hypothetical protein
VPPPALEAVARGALRTRGARLRSLEGMGPKRFVLSVDDDCSMTLNSGHDVSE